MSEQFGTLSTITTRVCKIDHYFYTTTLFLSQITSLTLFFKEPFGESFERGNRAIAVKMAK